MTIYDLIPKDKFDTETAEKLFYFAPEEVKPIVPDLLMWLQDINWPVSRPITRYLQAISEHITDEIRDVLKTNDDAWKYSTLNIFCLDTNEPLDPKLLEEIKRIASNPTPGERTEEVYNLAVEILKKHTE